MDLLEIANDGQNNEKYSNHVQLILDGPKLKGLPEDHMAQEFVHYKKRDDKKVFSKNCPL